MASHSTPHQDFQAAIDAIVNESTTKLIESSFDRISQLLEQWGKKEWSGLPRTYAILRAIDRTDLMRNFIEEGCNDLAIPYTKNRLPHSLDPSDRHKFILKQDLATTSSDESEISNGRHKHFSQIADVHFENLSLLGSGGSGEVHHVRCKRSWNEYARKRVLRKKALFGDKDAMKNFENELLNLKRLKHRHLVEFKGSYTDPKWICLLILPVADSDLATFLDRKPFKSTDRVALRGFYGCLASVILYLHNNQCRHKDIKPANILIKNQELFVTDFGAAGDWSNRSQSITSDRPRAYTRLYAAPEVISQDERGSSADIFSLGCVFLDMTTVLNGETLQFKSEFFSEHGTTYRAPADNPGALSEWLERPVSPGYELQPLIWIKMMLQQDRKLRLTAAALQDHIRNYQERHRYFSSCCEDDDSSDESIYVGSDSDGAGQTVDPLPSDFSYKTQTRILPQASQSDGLRSSTQIVELKHDSNKQSEMPVNAQQSGDDELRRQETIVPAQAPSRNVDETVWSASAIGMANDLRKLPAPPERNFSAYKFFVDEQRDGVRSDNPTVKFDQVDKIIGERWEALSEEQRASYDAKATEDRQQYESEILLESQLSSALRVLHGNIINDRLLVRAKAGQHGESLWDYMASGGPDWYWSVRQSKTNIVRDLIVAGADINEADEDLRREIRDAVDTEYDEDEFAVRLLLKLGAEINVRREDGSTALFSAAQIGHWRIAQALIESGAALNIRDNSGETALFSAARMGHWTTAQALIESGADLTIQKENGESALHQAVARRHFPTSQLLLEHGVDVNARRNDGVAAIHQAAGGRIRSGNEPLVRLLIEKGADVNARDKEQWTALHCAALANSDPIVRVLMHNGADTLAQDNKQRTPSDLTTYSSIKRMLKGQRRSSKYKFWK